MWNIHGLYTCINKVKLCKLDDFEVKNRIKMFDILCIQETLCGPRDVQSLSVEGYRKFSLHRDISNNQRYFGGILLLFKNNLRNGIKILENKGKDKVWIKLKKDYFGIKKDIFICFAYIPPDSSEYSKNMELDLFDNISEEISKYECEGNVLFAGDFNAKTSTESDSVIDLNDKHSPINDVVTYNCDIPIKRNNADKHMVDSQGKRLLELCKNSRIRILNGRLPGDRRGNLTRFPLSLRESPSTLDYMATDTELFKEVKSFYVLPNLGVSDHDCLCAELKTKFSIPVEDEKVNVNKINKIRFSNPLHFMRKLESPCVQQKISAWTEEAKRNHDLSSNDLLESFNTIFNLAAIGNAPKSSSNAKKNKKNYKRSKDPWYSDKCKVAKRKFNIALKNYRKQPFNTHLQQTLFSAKKQFKSVCRESEVRFRQELTSKLLDIEERNPSKFRDLIKKMNRWGSPENDPSSCIHPSEWMAHFQSLLNDGPTSPPNLVEELKKYEKSPMFSELDIRISDNEITNALKNLNSKASPGPDQISGELLKAGRKYLIPAYSLILNKIFSSSVYPEIWTKNFLKYSFKCADNCDPNNYRGIAIGAVFGKLFSLILLQRLEEWTKNTTQLVSIKLDLEKDTELQTTFLFFRLSLTKWLR